MAGWRDTGCWAISCRNCATELWHCAPHCSGLRLARMAAMAFDGGLEVGVLERDHGEDPTEE